MSDSEDDRRVCLLTGAGGLLGSTLCALWQETYSILAVCGSRLPPVNSQLISVVDPLDPNKPHNSDVYVVKADLAKDEELERIVDIALARYGAIDLLINNAVHSVWNPIVDSDTLMASAGKQFEINVVVPMKLSRIIAKRFWQKEGRYRNLQMNRHVLNVSSMAAVKVYENQGQSVYAASKAALNQATLHMASEFSRFGVRVNAVAPNSFPGVIPTEAVVEHMRRLDGTTDTGRILLVDALQKANVQT